MLLSESECPKRALGLWAIPNLTKFVGYLYFKNLGILNQISFLELMMPVPNIDRVANRLLNEKSIFAAHANPIDCSPGDRKFEKAKAEDKPVFLSMDIPPATGAM